MKKLFFFAIALLWTGFSSFSKTLSLQGEFINPSHRYIQYIGRISHKTPDAIRFNYPGVQIRASFRGTSLKMYAKPMSGKDRQRCPFQNFIQFPLRLDRYPCHSTKRYGSYCDYHECNRGFPSSTGIQRLFA